jgi:hypothetical protein
MSHQPVIGTSDLPCGSLCNTTANDPCRPQLRVPAQWPCASRHSELHGRLTGPDMDSTRLDDFHSLLSSHPAGLHVSGVSIRNCVDGSSPVAAFWVIFFNNMDMRTSIETDEVVVLSLLVSSSRLLHLLRYVFAPNTILLTID